MDKLPKLNRRTGTSSHPNLGTTEDNKLPLPEDILIRNVLNDFAGVEAETQSA